MELTQLLKFEPYFYKIKHTRSPEEWNKIFFYYNSSIKKATEIIDFKDVKTFYESTNFDGTIPYTIKETMC